MGEGMAGQCPGISIPSRLATAGELAAQDPNYRRASTASCHFICNVQSSSIPVGISLTPEGATSSPLHDTRIPMEPVANLLMQGHHGRGYGRPVSSHQYPLAHRHSRRAGSQGPQLPAGCQRQLPLHHSQTGTCWHQQPQLITHHSPHRSQHAGCGIQDRVAIRGSLHGACH